MMQLFTVKPGVKFNLARLKEFLPDVETALFFGKLYGMNAQGMSSLLSRLGLAPSLTHFLLDDEGAHSLELQSYLLDLGYEQLIEDGEITFEDVDPPEGLLLPEVWKSLELEIATSIRDVAEKLKDVVSHMPGKEGEMLFKSMMMLNARRPVLGDYRATIHHSRQLDNLVVLDVSGSMTEMTIRAIIEDVVAMSYMANAHLAIVSDTATVWGPGEITVDSVLKTAEYGGTQYETLVDLFDHRTWGVVVSIADYDSAPAAMEAFEQIDGRIEKLLDISLVSRPTFLSEVLGTQAVEREQLLIASSDWSCR
jgi:hypothetical protein